MASGATLEVTEITPTPPWAMIAEEAGVIAGDQVELTADIGPHPG